MAPRRKRITRLGEHLRAVREALGVDQRTFAAMVPVSDRTLSRWENGEHPIPSQHLRILHACEAGPGELHHAIAALLGVELEAPPPPPAPRPPSPAELRAALEAILLAAAEERDVLPRHLRAFGVALLREAARLGISASDAAELIAPREPTKTPAEESAT